MGERVVVVVAKSCEADERSLLVQNLIDDSLNDALDLLDARHSAESDGIDDVPRECNRTCVGVIRGVLKLLRLFLIDLIFLRRSELERGESGGGQPADDSFSALVRFFGRGRIDLGQENQPGTIRRVLVDANHSDSARATDLQEIAEARVIRQVEA